ncbi:MAG TPA: class I SAM-dependent methyltransferase, partial [Rubrobacteraceae bacterium]|nr:class I SAM-dependent methyltransferase [Rubrobacteraceae bacterium]
MYVEDMRKLCFRPAQAGWKPLSYERYFSTPLGAAIRAREEEAVYGFLTNIMEPHHCILEVGCGTGNYTVSLAPRCAGMLAIDASPEMLLYLRRRLVREGLTNAETQLGRLPDRLETPQRFDGALAIGVLNYVEDLEKSLRSLTSSLKPGGWAVFNVPLLSVEGRIYALTELANRRQINILSPERIV